MLKNYIKIAFRNLMRNKIFSIINITGLSLGLACCMLIFLYTKDEITFDGFHEKKANLYNLTCKVVEKDGKKINYGIAAMVQGPSFKQEIPEIESCTRVQNNNLIIKIGNKTFYEDVLWVDDNFFSVFTFPLLNGNPKTVLKDIRSIVLTDEIANKYFGKLNVIGETIQIEMNDKFEPFIVTGISKKSPHNSSIKFNILLSYNYQEEKGRDEHWLNLGYPTFFVLNPNANPKLVEAKMEKVFALRAGKEIVEERKHGFDATFTFGLQPLLNMHLNSEIINTPEVSNPIYSYILSGIALFILLIACINFVNLSVSQSLKRGKEIGIRKVIGGERKQLIFQFLGESFLLCSIAFFMAFAFAQLALPFFNSWTNKSLSLGYLMDFQLVLGAIILFLVTVFSAGFYPALVLSGLDPVKTLYNRFRFGTKNYLSKGLIVLQFTLATFMIITTFFIFYQFDFLTNKSLGYNYKNLLIVSVGRNGDHKLMSVFKNEFSKIPGITKIAKRQNGYWGTISKANQKDINVSIEHIDEDYLQTLEIPLIAGRNFSKDFPGDSSASVLVNKAYIKAAGWKGSGVGQTIDFLNGKTSKLQIIGVVKDYHYSSLKDKIQPQIFSMQPDYEYGRFFMRIDYKNRPKTLQAIEKVYHKLNPYRPFRYDYEEDLNLKKYESEAKWKQIIMFGTILMIFISCMGLLGLTMLSIQKRTKEIGVRKVLGANVFQILNLVSKNYIALIFISFFIAIPTAWFAVSKWLENFAYKIEISWQIFACAILITLLIAILTVSFQAIKAAMANPVESLRSE